MHAHTQACWQTKAASQLLYTHYQRHTPRQLCVPLPVSTPLQTGFSCSNTKPKGFMVLLQHARALPPASAATGLLLLRRRWLLLWLLLLLAEVVVHMAGHLLRGHLGV